MNGLHPFRRIVLFPTSHPQSVRFAIVASGLLLAAVLLRMAIPPGILPSGSTYVLTLAVFFGAFQTKRDWYFKGSVLVGFLVVAVLFEGLAPEMALGSAWLLFLQLSTFCVWTYRLFQKGGWNRDTHTLWTLTGLLEAILVPSLSFSRPLAGFSVLILVSLWALVESGRLPE